MKHYCLLLSLSLGLATGAPFTLTTTPANGSLAGAPGQTVGWGLTFTLAPGNANYYVLNQVEFCYGAQVSPCPATPLVGTFTDFAAAINGLIIHSSPYSEAFNAALQTGLGSYAINMGAAPQVLTGSLNIYYDVYNGDPSAGGNQILANQRLSNPAQVSITSSVPEPATSGLMAIGVGLVLAGCKRTLKLSAVSQPATGSFTGDRGGVTLN